MIDRTTKLRWRRRFRRRRSQVEGLGGQAEDNLERHFFRRLAKLSGIRRFVFSWLFLLILLSGITIAQTRSLSNYYLEEVPVAGGTFTEGMVGAFTNANPLYATGQVDSVVSKLVFAGLLKLDGQGNLINDLAQSWNVNQAGDEYTVKIKQGLTWHDGQPLTIEDVAFTYETAQHPDAKSPLFQTWREVDVMVVDHQTIKFVLKNPLASFAHSLATGIIPKHLLHDLPVEQLRSASFNTLQPVGAGPFVWQIIETVGTEREEIQQQIGLRRFENYHAGSSKLNQFVIHTHTSAEELIEDFEKQEVDAMVGLDSIPEEIVGDKSIFVNSSVTLAANMAFFKTDGEILKDAKVRRALLQAVDTSSIATSLEYPAILVDEPVLKEHFTYVQKYQQFGFDRDQASKLLDKQGWTQPAPGLMRERKGKPLLLRLYAQNTPDFAKVSQQLQQSWEELGVDIEVVLQSPEELQTAIANRGYDILLTGITIGPDPDVFAYWHSTQADLRSSNQLNFSDYQSTKADEALVSARTKVNPKLRRVKFEPFLEAWQKDVPAIGLYQPRFLYVTRGQVFNYELNRVTSGTDRLWNVHEWMIRLDSVVKAQ